MDPTARAPLSPRPQGACNYSTLRSPLPHIPTSVFPTLPTRCLQSVDAHSAPGLLALPNSFAPPSLPQQPPHTPPIWHSMATLPYAPSAAWDLCSAHPSHHVSRRSLTPAITTPIRSRAPKHPPIYSTCPASAHHVGTPPRPLKRLATPSYVPPPRPPRRSPALSSRG